MAEKGRWSWEGASQQDGLSSFTPERRKAFTDTHQASRGPQFWGTASEWGIAWMQALSGHSCCAKGGVASPL